MSFRWFIYYSAMCGGCAAFLGWLLGRIMQSENGVLVSALKGLCLGIILSLVLTLIDNLWNGTRQIGPLAMRLLVAGAVAAVGGFLGGAVAQLLYDATQSHYFQIVGWALTGVLIGGSVGVFDLIDRIQKRQPASGAKRKILNGLMGGGVGGLLGSIIYVLLTRPGDYLWTPGALGFSALGILIGLMVGLAQVMLKEAWVKVVDGYRPGRELIVSKPEITIGRAEGVDIGLYGDNRVEKLHARIIQQGDRYILEDTGTPNGTFVNSQRISGPTPLNSGDQITIGRNILRFGERAKRN